MIVRFFKSNSASGFILIPIVAIAIWVLGFFNLQAVPVKHTMPFYELLVRPVSGIPWLSALIALLLLIVEGFLLNYIVNENEALTKKSNLPALFYIIFMSVNSSMLTLHPVLFANLFILFALNKIFNSYRKDIAFSQVFDAGLLISIASLFYFPCIILFPVIGIALILFRPFNWREWVISFIGVLVPFIFVCTYYFWNDIMEYFLYDKMVFPIVFKKDRIPPSRPFYVLLGIGWFIVLLAFGKLFNGLSGGAQRTKKALILMIWLFIFGGISIFIAPQIATKYFALLAIPLSIICSNYYLRLKREFWSEILFLALLIALFVNLIIEIF
jgi:hypothetical protein